jgi:hypothetical protein
MYTHKTRLLLCNFSVLSVVRVGAVSESVLVLFGPITLLVGVFVCVSLTACVGSDTELIDESYSLYGVKLPTAGRSVVASQPRSQFPAPAVVPYDATRYAHPPASTNTVVY